MSLFNKVFLDYYITAANQSLGVPSLHHGLFLCLACVCHMIKPHFSVYYLFLLLEGKLHKIKHVPWSLLFNWWCVAGAE